MAEMNGSANWYGQGYRTLENLVKTINTCIFTHFAYNFREVVDP